MTPNRNVRDHHLEIPPAPVNAVREDVEVGTNPHITIEPSSLRTLRRADESYREYQPLVSGQIMGAPIERETNSVPAGERLRTTPDWDRDALVENMITLLSQCDGLIQERLVSHGAQCDEAYGNRVAEGPAISVPA